jgi:hypothetical protein
MFAAASASQSRRLYRSLNFRGEAWVKVGKKVGVGVRVGVGVIVGVEVGARVQEGRGVRVMVGVEVGVEVGAGGARVVISTKTVGGGVNTGKIFALSLTAMRSKINAARSRRNAGSKGYRPKILLNIATQSLQ